MKLLISSSNGSFSIINEKFLDVAKWYAFRYPQTREKATGKNVLD